MRQCVRYSDTFKEKLLAKVFSPHAPSAVELARRAGVPYPTLYTWITMRKKMNQPKSQEVPLRPHDKTAEAKLQAVSDTLGMSEEAQAAYCREHGLYTHHLEAWKEQVLAGLKPNNSKADTTEHRKLSLENKQLKSELHRKEKALAEASALLILKKKANLIWGDSEED